MIFDSIALWTYDSATRRPTMQQVEKADKEQLARWFRFLLGTTDEQRKTLRRVAQRFKEMGGMTPELSKKIGHAG